MAYGNYAPFYRGGYFNPMQVPTMPPMGDGQNQFAQPYQPPTAPQMQNTNGDFLWVLDEVEATSYPVAPNNTVTLWDKNHPTIYIKSANAQGVPSMRILDFTERTLNTPQTTSEHSCKCGCDNKDDIIALQSKFEEFSIRLSDLENKINSQTVEPKETEVNH